MITVAGFNTAIDRLLQLDRLQLGQVQRAQLVEVAVGGKGIHVARAVAVLGQPVRLIGLVDAAHHAAIVQSMANADVHMQAVETAYDLRHCLALREADGRTTELLESSEQVKPDVRQSLLDAVDTALDDSDLLILCGSLPAGFEDTTYADLVYAAARRGVPCLVDASGTTLRHAVDAAPHLVKPNADEAGQLTGRPVRDAADAASCVLALHADGVAQPVVTLGAQGVIGYDGHTLWHAELEIDSPRNAVGSGDCLLAGLATGLVRGQTLDAALRLGVACGAANAAEMQSGHLRAADVDELLPRVRMQRLSMPAAGGGHSVVVTDRQENGVAGEGDS